MAITPCKMVTDGSKRELAEHGTAVFPIACYHDDLAMGEVSWHWHDELEAMLVTEGTAVVAVENERRILKQGEGCFINSGVLHGAWDADTSNCRFHSLVFHSRLVGGRLDSIFYRKYVNPVIENKALECVWMSPDNGWQGAALSAIETAWQACARETDGYEFAVRNALSELMLLVRRHLPEDSVHTGAKAVRDGERIKAMLRYIHEHYDREINMRRIADSVSISESECLRCFRSTIKTTPIQYVKQYRIQKAAQLLAATGEKVAEIGSQCGFQDMSYFTKTFRELKGCTPTEYRRKSHPEEVV